MDTRVLENVQKHFEKKRFKIVYKFAFYVEKHVKY
jgi:hypothetical protein